MFLTKKVSILTMLISIVVALSSAFTVAKFLPAKPAIHVPSGPKCPETMEQIRLKNYELVHPLILSDISSESGVLLPMRNKVDNYIAQVKSTQQAENVSVYIRKLNDGSWFSINPNSTYNPASMSKIIYILVFLKEAETNPGVLNKKIFFAQHFSGGNSANIVDFKLSENSYYTVRDLLTYMIKYSDNDAALLLSQNMNTRIYEQLFVDLNIPLPDPYKEYFITIRDFGKFFRVLYSATYVRADLAEYGLKLLTLSTFSKGIKAGIDPSVPVAHKFGERIIGAKAQLHEFGIVFVNNSPYLIGVMTSGSNLDQLTQIVAEISRIVYTEYTSIYSNI